MPARRRHLLCRGRRAGGRARARSSCATRASTRCWAASRPRASCWRATQAPARRCWVRARGAPGPRARALRCRPRSRAARRGRPGAREGAPGCRAWSRSGWVCARTLHTICLGQFGGGGVLALSSSYLGAGQARLGRLHRCSAPRAVWSAGMLVTRCMSGACAYQAIGLADVGASLSLLGCYVQGLGTSRYPCT